MNFLSQLIHWLRYVALYHQSPRWDKGVSPPELMAFIDQHQPGNALDMGCGTGTNLVTLARYGWEVVGIDFILFLHFSIQSDINALAFEQSK